MGFATLRFHFPLLFPGVLCCQEPSTRLSKSRILAIWSWMFVELTVVFRRGIDSFLRMAGAVSKTTWLNSCVVCLSIRSSWHLCPVLLFLETWGVTATTTPRLSPRPSKFSWSFYIGRFARLPFALSWVEEASGLFVKGSTKFLKGIWSVCARVLPGIAISYGSRKKVPWRVLQDIHEVFKSRCFTHNSEDIMEYWQLKGSRSYGKKWQNDFGLWKGSWNVVFGRHSRPLGWVPVEYSHWLL